MKKGQRKWVFGAILAIGLMAWGASSYFKDDAEHASQIAPAAGGEEAHGGAPAGGPPPAVPVQAAIVKVEPVQMWNDYSGRLQAVDFVEVRPQVSGAIVEVKFNDGQLVNKGDVLFVIDPRPYKAALDQANADLQKAKNESTLAQKDLTRAQELIKTQAIAARLLDERQSNASVAKSSIDSAQARVNQAKLNYDYTSVTAPISGRVGRVEVTLGNLVQIGQPVLTTVVSNEGIYADFEVDEKTYMHLMQSASQASTEAQANKVPVKLTIGRDKDTGEVLDGYIHSFDNRIDTSSGTIRARALFANKDGKLLPGMFATVSMGGPSDEEQILVPSSAVGTDQDRKFVYVIGEGNKLVYREVVLGAGINGHRVVTSGIEPGEKIVIDGMMKLRPDMVVEPQIQASAAAVPTIAPQAPEGMKLQPKKLIEE